MTRSRRLTHIAFQLFLVLSLISTSWRHGLFAQWPLWQLATPYDYTISIGVLNLLPLIILLGLLVNHQTIPRHHWAQLNSGLTWALLALTLLALVRLDWQDTQLLLRLCKLLGFFYLSYLFVMLERPFLLPALALILLIQGSVGLLQFLQQSDVGLSMLGELPLDPTVEGISVLQARGQPWLRAYGLTPHPNSLGAYLMAILLLLLAQIGRSPTHQQWLLLPFMLLGLITLFLTFSRAAWLAFALPLLLWVSRPNRSRKFPIAPENAIGNSRLRKKTILLTAIVLFIPLLFFYDLALSRLITLDTPTEAQSIQQRLADTQTALQLIAAHPWSGVGTGQYVVAAQSLSSTAARVHNVLLWVTAEWGIMGFILALWIFLNPFFSAWQKRPFSLLLLPWLGMIIINQFDTTLWLFSNWQTAVLFALLASIQQPSQLPLTPFTPK